MSDRDNDSEEVHGVGEAVPDETCTCGENEACDVCAGETDEDEEERPISLDLTQSEALLLLHVTWNKKLEMADNQAKAPMASVMASIGLQVGREVYSDEMVDWLEERHEEREEMMEEMMEQMGGMFDMGGDDPLGQGGAGRLGFQ